jgi:hypothetical protein
VNDSKGLKFFLDGVPVAMGDNTSGGGAAYYAF